MFLSPPSADIDFSLLYLQLVNVVALELRSNSSATSFNYTQLVTRRKSVI